MIHLAIMGACRAGDLSWIKQYYNSGKLGEVLFDGSKALSLAAEYGHLDVIKWIVEESGQSVDITENKYYALRWATAMGHIDVVKWLIKDSATALENAAIRFSFSCRSQVLDITAGNNSLLNYLFRIAATNGHLDIVKWLVIDSTRAIKEASEKFGFELVEPSIDVSKALKDAHESTIPFLQAVLNCSRAGITLQQIQSTPEIADLVESGMDPKFVASLTATEILQLTSAKEMSFSKTLKL